jgi:UDP-glucuronate decarboxylase
MMSLRGLVKLYIWLILGSVALMLELLRVFNSYGPKLDLESRYARVTLRFIMQALKNEPLTIHDGGMQTRSFTYVTDAVNALIKVLLNDDVNI